VTEQEAVVGSCNDYSESIKSGEFLDQLREYWLLKNYAACN
jgi:hypothetical protein